MPRVPDDYIGSVIYLYPSEADAREGRQVGGSGFLVRVPFGDILEGGLRANQIYAVTNRHVLDDGNVFVRMNTRDATFDVMEIPATEWARHPLGWDVAIAPIMFRHPEWQYVAIPNHDLLTKKQADELNVGPGDDVFLVSRFLGHEGRARNLPILHMGVVSMQPLEDVKNERTGLGEPSYLVETHSRPGYSGSPVYGYISPNQPQLGVARDLTPRTFLLGVAWGFLPAPARIENDGGAELPAVVRMPSGIAAVIPAWHIQQVLDEEEIVNKRNLIEEAVKKQIK